MTEVLREPHFHRLAPLVNLHMLALFLGLVPAFAPEDEVWARAEILVVEIYLDYRILARVREMSAIVSRKAVVSSKEGRENLALAVLDVAVAFFPSPPVEVLELVNDLNFLDLLQNRREHFLVLVHFTFRYTIPVIFLLG